MSVNPHDKKTIKSIEFDNNRLMIELCGQLDSNLLKIEQSANVLLNRRGNHIEINGELEDCEFAEKTLRHLYSALEKGRNIDVGDVEAALKMPVDFFEEQPVDTGEIVSVQKRNLSRSLEIMTRKKRIFPRTITQKSYVRDLMTKDITFGVGPAGTGKTYLAVAMGVSLYLNGTVEKIILTRPAVEAGERLGFLPGDMKEKIDPYMQPLYDALRDCLPEKQISKMMESKLIEIAPLAFMRGRTLNNSFAVLDEAQNATAIQMKMFLTRLGQNSRMAITGDISQIDLPPGVKSGLIEVLNVLKRVKGVSFAKFSSDDVVRHDVVTRVIKAYEKYFSVNEKKLTKS